MPMGELKVKVNEYKDSNGNVNFDDILKLAECFRSRKKKLKKDNTPDTA